jgi:hypothetical protein
MHAFERMLAMAHTGQYSHVCELANQLRKYFKIQKDNLRARRYIDVAYIEGYINGLFYLLDDDKGRNGLPIYFGFNMPDMKTLKDYKIALAKKRYQHKASLSLAKRIVSSGKLGPRDGFHHTPFIDWDD